MENRISYIMLYHTNVTVENTTTLLTCIYRYSNATKSLCARSHASLGTNATLKRHRKLCEPGLAAICNRTKQQHKE